MEHLPGGSVADRIAQHGPPSLAEALGWLADAAAGLDAAHRRGIVHRDVKPGNLLLDARENVHVGDFGVASAVGLDSLTATGTVLGTAGYLSPEQAQGSRATAASDRYALGVVAFELLTGERPYERESATAEAAAHVNAPVPSACNRRTSLPCELDAVFERALAKAPEDRFESCAGLVAALRGALARAEQPTRAIAPPPAAAPRVHRRRGRGLALGALVATAAAAGGLAAALLVGRGSTTSVRLGAPRTVHDTVTVRRPAQPPPPPASPPPPVSTASGSSLNDQGYRLMQDGRYSEALPLLRQAVAKLRGTYTSGFRYEAWADYNLAYTLLRLGRCREVVPLLDRSQALQGHRVEIDRARAAARSC
jgi:hypothetical protein